MKVSSRRIISRELHVEEITFAEDYSAIVIKGAEARKRGVIYVGLIGESEMFVIEAKVTKWETLKCPISQVTAKIIRWKLFEQSEIGENGERAWQIMDLYARARGISRRKSSPICPDCSDADCDTVRSKFIEWIQQLAPVIPKCQICNGTGVIATGNNDIPCDCPAGDIALFNRANVDGKITGAEFRRHFLNNSPWPIIIKGLGCASILPGREIQKRVIRYYRKMCSEMPEYIPTRMAMLAHSVMAVEDRSGECDVLFDVKEWEFKRPQQCKCPPGVKESPLLRNAKLNVLPSKGRFPWVTTIEDAMSSAKESLSPKMYERFYERPAFLDVNALLCQ